MDTSITAAQAATIATLTAGHAGAGISAETDGSGRIRIQVGDDDGEGGEYAVGHWIITQDGAASPTGTSALMVSNGI